MQVPGIEKISEKHFFTPNVQWLHPNYKAIQYTPNVQTGWLYLKAFNSTGLEEGEAL